MASSDIQARADRAERILKDPAFVEAIDSVRQAIVNGWMGEKPSNVDAKEEWHRRLHTLDSVLANIARAVQDGRLDAYREKSKVTPFLGDLSKWTPKVSRKK